MKRPGRIAFELLGPPLAGSLPIAVLAGSGQGMNHGVWHWLEMIALLVGVVGYGFGILPSLAYTLAMEIAFAKGLDPASTRTVLWSGWLGLLAGVALGVAVTVGTSSKNSLVMPLLVGTWGLAIGLLHGAVIQHRSLKARA